MKLYKLTDKNDQTHGGCQWGENVTIKTSGKGPLCGPGWTHWYAHPLLAVLLNPIHGCFDLEIAHLWEGEGDIGETDRGLKVGCASGTTLTRVPLPVVTLEQRVTFAILCALEVYQVPEFVAWAEKWLKNKDRAAEAAAWAAEAAAGAAWVAAGAATGAAWVAAGAAWAAEAAAWAAGAAAGAAWVAAKAAARAAEAAAWAAEIDLIHLAVKAVDYPMEEL